MSNGKQSSVIVLNKSDFYARQLFSYEDYLKNYRHYQKLITQYSKTIAKKNTKPSITDLVPKPDKYAVELSHISKYYLTERKVNKVFFNISLKIKHKDFVVILGPSGSGKTSLLNIMAGLDSADSGDVYVHGKNLTLMNNSHLTIFRRQYIGLIFQQYNLLQNITVAENIELGANLLEDKSRAIPITELMEILEISEFADSFPYQLSGGQQQRCSIARALAKNPRILFCDEPTGALDQKMSRKVLSTLLMINKKYQTTIVLVTHNENFAKVANSVIRFKDGQVIDTRTNQKMMDVDKLEI